MLEFICLAGNKKKDVPAGQVLFATPGPWYWEVPEGVERIMVACQGAGSWPLIYYSNSYSEGGQGGYCAYSNNIPVTPGEILTVQVGAGKTLYSNITTNTSSFNSPNNIGSPSFIKRGTTSLVYAPGGREGTTNAVGSLYTPRGLDSVSGGGNGSGFSSSRNRLGGDAAGFQSNPGSHGTGSVGGKGVVPVTGALTASPTSQTGANYGGGASVTFSSTTSMTVGGSGGGYVRILWDGTSTKKRSIPSNMPNV